MSANAPHIAHRVVFDLEVDGRRDHRPLQDLQSRLIHQCAIPVLEELCDRLLPAGQTVRVEDLKIEVGEIRPERFEHEFPRRFREAAERALRQLIAAETRKEAAGRWGEVFYSGERETPTVLKEARLREERGPAVSVGRTEADFRHWVETGAWPWWSAAVGERQPVEMLTALPETEWEAAGRGLRAALGKASARQRIYFSFRSMGPAAFAERIAAEYPGNLVQWVEREVADFSRKNVGYRLSARQREQLTWEVLLQSVLATEQNSQNEYDHLLIRSLRSLSQTEGEIFEAFFLYKAEGHAGGADASPASDRFFDQRERSPREEASLSPSSGQAQKGAAIPLRETLDDAPELHLPGSSFPDAEPQTAEEATRIPLEYPPEWENDAVFSPPWEHSPASLHRPPKSDSEASEAEFRSAPEQEAPQTPQTPRKDLRTASLPLSDAVPFPEVDLPGDQLPSDPKSGASQESRPNHRDTPVPPAMDAPPTEISRREIFAEDGSPAQEHRAAEKGRGGSESSPGENFPEDPEVNRPPRKLSPPESFVEEPTPPSILPETPAASGLPSERSAPGSQLHDQVRQILQRPPSKQQSLPTGAPPDAPMPPRFRQFYADLAAGKLPPRSDAAVAPLYRSATAPERRPALFAGQVLLWALVPTMFSRLGLLREGNFPDAAHCRRAVLLLHALTSGETSAQEPELLLPKLFCGLPPEAPVELEFVPTPEEQAECDSLLRSVCQNWPPLRNSDLEDLRRTFLMRPGVLIQEESFRELRVEAGPFDMLLEMLPWSYTLIFQKWMEMPLHVHWRTS